MSLMDRLLFRKELQGCHPGHRSWRISFYFIGSACGRVPDARTLSQDRLGIMRSSVALVELLARSLTPVLKSSAYQTEEVCVKYYIQTKYVNGCRKLP
jgi:hypothetical protein